MLIGGHPVSTIDSVEAVFDRLEALPSGFERPHPVRVSYLISPEAEILSTKGVDVFTLWTQNGNKALLNDAAAFFMKAIEIHSRSGTVAALANDLGNLGHCLSHLGRHEEAIATFDKAARHFLKSDQPEGALSALCAMYDDCGALLKTAEDRTDLLDRQGALRQKITELFPRHRNEPLDKRARYIPQGHIGLSDCDPIGTSNVHECICIILRHPLTCKTALAHIDEHSKIAVLADIIEDLQDSPGDTAGTPVSALNAAAKSHIMIEARILGGRYSQSVNDEPGDMRDAAVRSQSNLHKVVTFLKAQAVNILSARTGDKEQPSAIVVDPRTFEISAAVPGLTAPNDMLRDAIPFFYSIGRDLCISSDLTKGETSRPVLLPQQALTRLRDRVCGQDADQVHAWLTGHTQTNPGQPSPHHMSKKQAIAATHGILALMEAYDAAANALVHRMNSRIDVMVAQGCSISPQARADIIHVIRGNSAFHVGEGADEANEPLARFLETDFLQSDAQGRITANYGALISRFDYSRFPAPAFHAMAAPQSAGKAAPAP